MNFKPIVVLSATLSLLLSLLPCRILAEERVVELTPSVSLGEEYDDNLYLSAENPTSDYLTTLTPGLDLTFRSQKDDLSFHYAPSFVRYLHESENDTIRHSGALRYGRDLAEHLKLDLSDTYIKSEEPIETTEDIVGDRRTRNTYDRNVGNAALSYAFGPESALNLGYSHSLVKNEDPTLDDGTTQTPFANLTHWFNVRHGMELNYTYTQADFSRDDDFEAQDDYKGHATGLRYLHRFTPHTSGSLGYDYTTRDFDGLSEDYTVHDISVDFEHAFAPDFSISAGLGLFQQHLDVSDNQTGYSYDLTLLKTFERATLTVGGRGGWDESYLDAEQRGFVQFQSLNARLTYQFLERLGGYADAAYRQDKDDADRQWKTLRGGCGLAWSFMQWFSLALDYSYSDRSDDIETDEYTANRVMLILSGSKIYRW